MKFGKEREIKNLSKPICWKTNYCQNKFKKGSLIFKNSCHNCYLIEFLIQVQSTVLTLLIIPWINQMYGII